MRYVGILIAIILLAGGGYWLLQSGSGFNISPNGDTTNPPATSTPNGVGTSTPGMDDNDDDTNGGDAQTGERTEVIGTSVEDRDITAHHFGSGDTEILFVGGIHGGYGWNTTLLAREFLQHLRTNPDFVPAGVTVTVIPVLNPDGLAETVGTAGEFNVSDVPAQDQTIAGRFNANDVDLNRNFNCDWQSQGQWRDQTVDAGSEPFSEPESAALRDYVSQNEIAGAVVWFAASGDVVAASCQEDPSEASVGVMGAYADAAGYSAREEFDYYTITGDSTNWMAKQGIPAISVILDSHRSSEWSKNREGIQAALEYFAQE